MIKSSTTFINKSHTSKVYMESIQLKVLEIVSQTIVPFNPLEYILKACRHSFFYHTTKMTEGKAKGNLSAFKFKSTLRTLYSNPSNYTRNQDWIKHVR